jgi:hypothetical protein
MNVPYIPQRFQAPCEFCGRNLNVSTPGTYQHGSGWFANRKQGGANAVALPERHDRWACGPCIDLLRSRGAGTQGTMF